MERGPAAFFFDLMPRFVRIRHRHTGQDVLARACWADSFLARLRGLMFRRALEPGEALVLAEPTESRAATSIHMFFVPFPIGVAWVNSAGRVVDTVVAQPWQPFYAAREPARYVLETHPEFIQQVHVGDEWDFEPLTV